MKYLKTKNRRIIGTTVLVGSFAVAAAVIAPRLDEFRTNFTELQKSLNYELYKNEASRCPFKEYSKVNLHKECHKVGTPDSEAQICEKSLNEQECRIEENTEFRAIGEEVLEVQEKIRIANRINLLAKGDVLPSLQNKVQRVFHAKQHGCFTAKFELTNPAEREKQITSIYKRNPKFDVDSVVALTMRGVFDAKVATEYKSIVRISSGLGLEYSDIVPDVKGFAIKLIGVKDGSETRAVDFLMTSGPNPFGSSLRDFANFMQGAYKDIQKLGGFLTPPIAAGLFIQGNPSKAPEKSSVNALQSLATLQYWSGHPYLMGAGENSSDQDIAMKFNIVPSNSEDLALEQLKEVFNKAKIKFDPKAVIKMIIENQSNQKALISELSKELGSYASELGQIKIVDLISNVIQPAQQVFPNFLRNDLVNRLAKGPIKFDFNIQLENGAATPVENTLIEWKESDSPSIKVATLTIEQQNFDSPEIDQMCDEATFTPGHYHTLNRPLSNMGRGRIVAYRASQLGRSLRGTLASDLDENSFDALETYNGSKK